MLADKYLVHYGYSRYLQITTHPLISQPMISKHVFSQTQAVFSQLFLYHFLQTGQQASLKWGQKSGRIKLNMNSNTLMLGSYELLVPMEL